MPDFFITLRELEVRRIEAVTPGIQRITLTGDELGEFVRDGVSCPGFMTGAFDDHVKIFPPGDGELILPSQHEGHLHWPDDPPSITRDYTVRRFDRDAGELDLEIAIGHDGPGSRWAHEARVGDRLHVAGPRGYTAHPADAPAYVLIGDDASLPPIARFLDTHEGDAEVVVIAVVDRDNADYPLPGANTTLIVRDDADGHADPDELFDHVRTAVGKQPDAFVWAALELRTARQLRRVLNDAGVAKAQRYVTHYWRRGPGADADDKRAAVHQLQPMIDLTTPMVLRVAVTTGLLDAIDSGADTASAAATATGCDPDATSAILAYLTHKGLTEYVGEGRYAVTGLGGHLLDEEDNYLAKFLDLDTSAGHFARSMSGLLHATRSGQSGYERVEGRTFWDALAGDDRLGADFDERLAGWAQRWLPGVVGHDVFARSTTVVDIGGGNGALSVALAEAHDDLSVTLVELEGPARRARDTIAGVELADRVDVTVGSFFDPLPAGRDVYVLAQVLHDWPDEDARRILQRCAEALPTHGRVLVVERLVDEAAPPAHGDHAEMGVLMLALFGAKERTSDDFTSLLADVGLEVAGIERSPDLLSVIEARLPSADPPRTTPTRSTS